MDKRQCGLLLYVTGTVILCLSLFYALSVQAHNGAVAIAVPVEGIVVDGDLSDWPEGMRRYAIVFPEYGMRPKDTEDFEGSFRVGYDAQENALYVAVEVRDGSTVIDTTVGVHPVRTSVRNIRHRSWRITFDWMPSLSLDKV